MTRDSILSSVWLGFRSLMWTALLPGFIAGHVPWRYFGLSQIDIVWTNPRQQLGLICIVVGSGLLAACIWEFARWGRGTLAPVDPPRALVVRGLYRHVRNPMYLSVTTILLGEVLLAASLYLLAYWTGWFIAVNVFVRVYEEPTLRRQYAASYEAYTRSVGRWLPRRRSRGSVKQAPRDFI